MTNLTTAQKVKKAITKRNGHTNVIIDSFKTRYSNRVGKMALIYYSVNGLMFKLELSQCEYYSITGKLI